MKQNITTNCEKRKQKQSWDTNGTHIQENLKTQIDKTEVRANINEEWANIKTIIVNSAKEIIGIRKKERNICLMMNVEG